MIDSLSKYPRASCGDIYSFICSFRTPRGEDGERHRPYMVHRALLGSMERFFGVLIEHYAGAFPVWLCPVQAMIIPITDEQLACCDALAKRLKESGIRCEIDKSTNRMAYKIHQAQEQKIPYMLVVGKREAESGNASVRLRTEEDLGPLSLDAFVKRARQVINDKTGL